MNDIICFRCNKDTGFIVSREGRFYHDRCFKRDFPNHYDPIIDINKDWDRAARENRRRIVELYELRKKAQQRI